MYNHIELECPSCGDGIITALVPRRHRGDHSDPHEAPETEGCDCGYQPSVEELTEMLEEHKRKQED